MRHSHGGGSLNPAQKREGLGFLLSTIGGGFTLVVGGVFGQMATKAQTTSAQIIVISILLVLFASVLALGVAWFMKVRFAIVGAIVAVLTLVPIAIVVPRVVSRHRAVAGLANAYHSLWPVCVEKRGIPAAAPLGDGLRPTVIYDNGSHWEPEERWLPKSLEETQLVGCLAERWPGYCVIEFREARTAKVVGRATACNGNKLEMSALIAPAEKL